MKMFYGSVPVNSLNVKSTDISTNDATMVASDLQAGITAYARGRKITGTGKSFEFAYYGDFETNDSMFIPAQINVIHFSSADYPTQNLITLNDMSAINFADGKIVGNVVVNEESYPVTVKSNASSIEISCDITINLQIFFGKDNYV